MMLDLIVVGPAALGLALIGALMRVLVMRYERDEALTFPGDREEGAFT
jgi:hypothetical protein